MKKLTLVFTIVALSTFSFSSFAQNLGIKAGMNISKYSNYLDAKMLLGFHIGATAEFEVANFFSVEPGLFLSTKGYKLDDSTDNLSIKVDANEKRTPVYIEIPINGRLSFDLGNTNVYLLSGPYIAFGVGGKNKYKTDDKNESNSIKWGDNGMKRIDMGINIGTGVEFGAIGIGVQYGIGLSEVLKDTKFKNRVIGVSLSYKLGE